MNLLQEWTVEQLFQNDSYTIIFHSRKKWEKMGEYNPIKDL